MIARRSRPAAAAGTLGAVAMSLAVSFVGGWEGKRNEAYRDVVGVATVCYGETRGVQMGDYYTDAQCNAMLAEGIQEFATELDRRCFDIDDKPPEMQVAFVSWSYNVGIGAACSSTLARRVNAGDLRGACDQLPRWNRAGGRVWKGLTRRRSAERELCYAGLEAMR